MQFKQNKNKYKELFQKKLKSTKMKTKNKIKIDIIYLIK